MDGLIFFGIHGKKGTQGRIIQTPKDAGLLFQGNQASQQSADA
jgi:hypothetical protein